MTNNQFHYKLSFFFIFVIIILNIFLLVIIIDISLVLVVNQFWIFLGPILDLISAKALECDQPWYVRQRRDPECQQPGGVVVLIFQQ